MHLSRPLGLVFMGLGLVTALFTTSCVPQRTGVESAPSAAPTSAPEKLATCNTNLRLLGTALELYAKDADGAYPPTLTAISPLYLREVPTCPASGTDTYSGGYAAAAGGFTIACKGTFHADAGQPADHPSLSSGQPLKPSSAASPQPSNSPAPH